MVDSPNTNQVYDLPISSPYELRAGYTVLILSQPNFSSSYILHNFDEIFQKRGYKTNGYWDLEYKSRTPTRKYDVLDSIKYSYECIFSILSWNL